MISTPLPFARWGLDIVGPLSLSKKKKKYIFVMVDYFTKWMEVEAVSIISSKMTIDSSLETSSTGLVLQSR